VLSVVGWIALSVTVAMAVLVGAYTTVEVVAWLARREVRAYLDSHPPLPVAGDPRSTAAPTGQGDPGDA
jgi:hypothetical protein